MSTEAGGEGMKRPYKSFGSSPVRLAIFDSITGPISSPSWNANTKSGQPVRARVRCEPVCRICSHPIWRRALRTFLALLDGHELTRPRERNRQPPERLRHFPRGLRGCATPAPRPCERRLPWTPHSTSPRVARESQRSSDHLPRGQSRWRIASRTQYSRLASPNASRAR